MTRNAELRALLLELLRHAEPPRWTGPGPGESMVEECDAWAEHVKQWVRDQRARIDALCPEESCCVCGEKATEDGECCAKHAEMFRRMYGPVWWEPENEALRKIHEITTRWRESRGDDPHGFASEVCTVIDELRQSEWPTPPPSPADASHPSDTKSPAPEDPTP